MESNDSEPGTTCDVCKTEPLSAGLMMMHVKTKQHKRNVQQLLVGSQAVSEPNGIVEADTKAKHEPGNSSNSIEANNAMTEIGVPSDRVTHQHASLSVNALRLVIDGLNVPAVEPEAIGSGNQLGGSQRVPRGRSPALPIHEETLNRAVNVVEVCEALANLPVVWKNDFRDRAVTARAMEDTEQGSSDEMLSDPFLIAMLEKALEKLNILTSISFFQNERKEVVANAQSMAARLLGTAHEKKEARLDQLFRDILKPLKARRISSLSNVAKDYENDYGSVRRRRETYSEKTLFIAERILTIDMMCEERKESRANLEALMRMLEWSGVAFEVPVPLDQLQLQWREEDLYEETAKKAKPLDNETMWQKIICISNVQGIRAEFQQPMFNLCAIAIGADPEEFLTEPTNVALLKRVERNCYEIFQGNAIDSSDVKSAFKAVREF